MKKRIAVGMSGGVDSSVAAALLVEQGYDVTGIFIEAYNEPGCRTDEDKRDALKVAAKLGIKFEVLDLKKEYKEKVVNYFIYEYQEGRTPNPDIVCNGEIKFGLLLDYIRSQGFEKLATGHYARNLAVTQLKGDTVTRMLQRPKDLTKDQTYFLWKVGEEKLKNIIFPLGELTKSEVRAKARRLALPNAEKPDSMGVCMMGEISIYDFLKNKIGEREGQVVWNGKVVGTHKGSWFYTLGQRGGWVVKPKIQTADMPSLYVISKNMENNQLIMGTKEECYKTELGIRNLEFRMNSKDLWVRIRNLGELTKVTQLQGDTVTLKDPVFAPAPGQSAVFYDDCGIVMGGGLIG